MNPVHFQPQAVTDVVEATEWYEVQQPGLGVEFVLELDAAVERAAENPRSYAVQYREARRVLLRRFPYAIYFVFDRNIVEVFAVLRQQRESALWQSRTP